MRDLAFKLLSGTAIFFSVTISGYAQNSSCIEGPVLSDSRFAGAFHSSAKAANRYCHEFKDDPSLRSIYGFSLDGKHARIVRIFESRATYTWYEDMARFKELELDEAQITTFKAEINKIDVDSQPALINPCVDMCSAYHFLKIENGRGKIIPIASTFFFPPAPFNSIGDLFRKWNANSNIKTRYYLQGKFTDAQVLISDDKFAVRSVWESNGDLAVLILERGSHQKTEPSWRLFFNEQSGLPIDQPKGSYFLNDFQPKNCGREMVINNYPFERRIGDDLLCVGTGKKEGLWIVGNGKEKRLLQGEYNSPIVTRNQKWIIASKGDSDKPIWKSSVRIHVETKKEFRIEIPKADCFYPSASLPNSDEVLVVRCKANHTSKENNPSPDPPEYYILNSETGRVRKTAGEIRPVMHQQTRYLQRSHIDNKFWAAIPDIEKDLTEVGLYDPKNLYFESVLSIPSIRFYSGDMYVDEKKEFLYIVYEFELLRIPLDK